MSMTRLLKPLKRSKNRSTPLRDSQRSASLPLSSHSPPLRRPSRISNQWHKQRCPPSWRTSSRANYPRPRSQRSRSSLSALATPNLELRSTARLESPHATTRPSLSYSEESELTLARLLTVSTISFLLLLRFIPKEKTLQNLFFISVEIKDEDVKRA